MALKATIQRVRVGSQREAKRTRCVTAKAHMQPHVAALSTFAAAVLLSAAPAFAEDGSPSAPSSTAPNEPTTATTQSSTATSISFARVDMSVTKKLRERDENMAWKCQGVNMYDCDGELAAAAEKRFDEIASMFRSK